MEKETRSFNIEIRANELGSRVEGYAATFTDYDMGDFIERIAPTAFENLEQQDIRALFNHDANAVLALSLIHI